MNNVMVDLETPDNKPTSGIVSIGAVKFDATGISDDRFYCVVDLQSSIDAGLTVSASTISWWMKQSDQARAVFNEPDACHLAIALQLFAAWLPDNCKLWGNGAGFDNPILANAYAALKMQQPWDFWNDRCYRTIAAMHPNNRRQQQGTHHNALDDAISQAQHLIAIAPGIL